jgi:hypothetical protein
MASTFCRRQKSSLRHRRNFTYVINFTLEEVNSGLLYEGKGLVQLAPGQETELTIGKDVESQNYLSIQLVTGVNLVGYIHYHETNNTANTHKEKIYIEAQDKTFSMFLDAFRVGAYGGFRAF